MGNPSKIPLRKDTCKLRFRMNIGMESCRLESWRRELSQRVVEESLRVTKLELS